MPLLEEVDEGMEGSSGGAEGLKAEHRRKRASKARKKKRVEGAHASSGAIIRVLLEAAVVIGFGCWARSKATDKKSNSCKMTFSRPEYVHLPVPGYPSGGKGGKGSGEALGYGYRLMRYMDRKLPAGERADPLKPGGTPVVFVPGHLGSYEQARSLGSHAAEMKISSPTRRLDIFALDLLEEWSALHGSLVWRQAEFLNHAVEAILALYPDTGTGGAHSVESVMVVGHSLGGIVTRAAFTLPSYRVGSITDIITLGTPHERAPWGMDFSYMGLYRCTDSLWRWHSSRPGNGFAHCWSGAKPIDDHEASRPQECLGSDGGADTDEGGCLVTSSAALTDDSTTATGASDAAEPGSAGEDDGTDAVRGWGRSADLDARALLGNTVLLGVSGGVDDLMVHPSLCVTDGLGLEGQSASFTTEAMEGCGFGVDHLALAWCKQLIGRVVATLSELERLHSSGAGAKERTLVASELLASSRRSLDATLADERHPKSAGFEEASRKGDEFLMVARALASDRMLLIIPAWAYFACLVIAAALVRGLVSKTAKERALPPVPLLLTPEGHLQLGAAKRSLRSFWATLRSKGAAATAAFVTSCAVVVIWALGDEIASYFPDLMEKALDFVYSVPGGAVGVTTLRLLSGTTSNLVRFLNPFDGAGNALRLPPFKGILAVYLVSAGWMMVFVHFVAFLGTMGNGIRRLLPTAAPLRRLLRSRKVAAAAVCVAGVAAHVETLSLPPTFREVTLKGELSVVFMMLSVCLYALLGSLVLFPSHSPVAATHQHLVLFLYAPLYALLNGPQIAAAGILLRRGGSSHEPFLGSAELVLSSLALLPIIGSVWLARSARPFPSPPGLHAFWEEFQAQWAEEVARANGGSIGAGYGVEGSGGSGAAGLAAAALERPNGHGSCGKCLHADGGSGAIFVETDKERVLIGAGVALGPGFRVVACDCPRREPAAPSSWCEFCRCVCKVCGGCKEAARAMRGARGAARGGGGGTGRGREGLSAILGAASSTGLVSVVVLYVGLWAFGMKILAEPCHALTALATVGVVLCGMHWGVAKDAASSRSRL